MDGLRDTATRDISKPTFRRPPASISYSFSVTVVKVLHFIDGVKWYVGRFLGTIVQVFLTRSVITTSWYFLSNLDFDWRLIRRKPTVTWPSLVHASVEIMRSRIFMLTGPE